jgi:hypothetical protein
MGNATFQAVQFDADANEIEGTLTSKMEESVTGAPAKALDVNALNASLKKASYEISGGAQIDENIREDLRANQDSVESTMSLMQTQIAGGEEIPAETIKGMVRDMTSIMAQYGRIGGEQNDEALVTFRLAVEAAAEKAWKSNARVKQLRR